MTFSNLYKQLKRRLRMRKRWLSLGAYVLLAGGTAAALWMDYGSGNSEPEAAVVLSTAVGALEQSAISPEATEAALNVIRKGKGTRDVLVHRKYVCGEETEQLGPMAVNEILSLYKDHPDARLVLDESGKVHFMEDVEDLAPKCKENAYFGMDKNGNLTLFEGIPEQDRVIRTFFQLNVQHLKSSLPADAVNQLYSGIHITDLADYNSVLSTFSEYAADHAEPVANPRP